MKKMRTKVAVVATVFALALSSMGPVSAKSAESTGAAPGLAEQIHETSEKVGIDVSVKMTDIPASGVAAGDGYAAPIIFLSYGTEEEPQTYRLSAVVDQEGKLIFPYKCSRMSSYGILGGVISFAQAYPALGIRKYTIDGEDEYCRYYDLDKNELFDPKLRSTDWSYGDIIASTNEVYDMKGNLLYKIPSDLLEATAWMKGDTVFPKFKGYPQIKCNYQYSMVQLDCAGEGNLIPFMSAIPMKDKLELPDLKGTKWEEKNDYIGYFFENMVKDGKLSGYIDTTGKIVIPQSFGKCGPFSEGLAWVLAPGTIKTPEVISPEGEVKRDVFLIDRLLGLFEINEAKSGFIDKTGKLVIPFEYDNVYPFFNGVAQVCKGEKWGYIDKSNNVIIPIEYDYAFGGENGFYSVVKDEKCGIVDSENRVVIPFVFDDISTPSKGIIYGVYDGKIVIMNLNQDSKSDWDHSADKTAYLPQIVTIKTSSKSVKAAKLKKKAQSFKIASESVTKITFKKKSGDKRIKVSSGGKITLKKGLPKKTYKIKVNATAKDDGLFKSVSTTKTIKITVK